MNQNPIVELFSKLNPLSEQATKDFNAIISKKSFSRNTQLLDFGKIADTMYFIEKGLARAYYYHEGKDVTDYFAIDGQFIGAVPSLFTKALSKKAIQLIEDSEVFYFTSNEFEDCCAQHHDLERAARRMMTFGILQEQERIESLRFYSAKERYELMERNYPGITNRSPLQYIASYIGTTQVSISRIRAGIQ